MKSGERWAALGVHYMRDEKVRRVIRGLGPGGRMLVAAYWPQVIALASRHHGEPFDVVLEDVAEDVGDDRPRAALVALWAALADLHMITVLGDLECDGHVVVELVNYDDWQVPAGTKRSRKSRAANAPEQGESAPDERPATPCNAMQRDATPCNDTVPDLTEPDLTQSPLSESLTPTPVDNSGQGWPKHCKATDWEQEATRQVFTAWRSMTGRDDRPGPATRLTRGRADVVVHRLRDGFSVDDLVSACRHWHADPYHRGVNDQQTVYDDLTTFLKDDTKVAKALEASPRSAATGLPPLHAIEAMAAAKRLDPDHTEHGAPAA